MRSSHLDPRAELLARLDAAVVCEALSVSVGGATRHDVQMFAYLASMVNSQYGEAPSAWGYTFAASPTGLPFAEALDFTMDHMITDGDLIDFPSGYQPGSTLRDRVTAAANGDVFSRRIRLVEDVANIVVFRALPTIGRALRGEPQLARAADIRAVRLIDQDELAETLMKLILSVRNKLDGDFPAALPAMIWLDAWERASES